MSGGVDSSAAAVLLKDSGYELVGVTLRLMPSEHESKSPYKSNLIDARFVAKELDIEHIELDCREYFTNTIIIPFKEAYLNGTTPNPCVWCNPKIKFELVLEKIRDMKIEQIATGHYARIKTDEDGNLGLWRGLDRKKEQSYFLYRLKKEILSHVIFPLGELTKDQIREIAKKMGIERKSESQEICFIPGGDYRTILKDVEVGTYGKICDVNGNVLGSHKGIHNYTIGQRKGLGLGKGPWYVKKLDIRNNTIIVGSAEDIMTNKIKLTDINTLIPVSAGDEMDIQIRYKQEPVAVKILETKPDCILVETVRPVSAATPGQSGVLYKGDRVAAGGIII